MHARVQEYQLLQRRFRSTGTFRVAVLISILV